MQVFSINRSGATTVALTDNTTLVNGSVGTTTWGTLSIGSAFVTAESSFTKVGELIAWNSSQSANQTAISTDLQTYWN